MQDGRLCDVSKSPYNVVNGTNGTAALQVQYRFYYFLYICVDKFLFESESFIIFVCFSCLMVWVLTVFTLCVCVCVRRTVTLKVICVHVSNSRAVSLVLNPNRWWTSLLISTSMCHVCTFYRSFVPSLMWTATTQHCSPPPPPPHIITTTSGPIESDRRLWRPSHRWNGVDSSGIRPLIGVAVAQIKSYFQSGDRVC